MPSISVTIDKCFQLYPLVQIDGFLFLLIGSALYNEIIDLPCWNQESSSENSSSASPPPKDDFDGQSLFNWAGAIMQKYDRKE